MIDERADLCFRLVAAVGEAANQLLVQVGVERRRHLAVRRRVGVLGEDVRGGLVVADVQRVGKRADLVERAAQEQLVAGHAGQVERRRRHQEDLVAGAGEIELLLAAVFEVGDDRLAASVLKSRIASRTSWTLPHSAAVPVGRITTLVTRLIDLGLAQRVDQRAHRRRSLEELADHAARLDLLQVAADAQHERGVAVDPRARRRPASP